MNLERKKMLIIDLPVNADYQAEAQMQDYYPEEVLNAGWNPVLEEIQSLQTRMDLPVKPTESEIAAISDRIAV